MKNAVRFVFLTAALTAALLLGGCKGSSGDIDLVPEPDFTTENDMETEEVISLDRRILTPFIMPQQGTEEYLYYSSKIDGDCVPGYLYLKNSAEDTFLLLTSYEFDEKDGLYQYVREEKGYVNWRYVYGVAKLPDGEKILAVDKVTGTYSIVYTPSSGSVEMMTASERHGDDSGRLFFKDGDSVIALMPESDETVVCAKSESGVTDIKGEAFIYERIKTDGVSESDAYVCKECGSEYFTIWADGEGQYYWYHVHSGVSEPIDFQYLYYPFYCFNDLIFSGSITEGASAYDWEDWGAWGQWKLYARSRENGERTLLMDNVIYRYINFVNHISLFIALQDGVERLMTIDERTGELETVYEFQGSDVQIMDCSYEHYGDEYEDSGFSFAHSFLFCDGKNIVKLNGNTLKAETAYTSRQAGLEFLDRYTYSDAWLLRDGNVLINLYGDGLEAEELFTLENGLSKMNFYPYAESQLAYGFLEDEDTSDFYICEECSLKENYFIWADNDMNWFWYHPHSGENEPIIVDSERYTYIDWEGNEKRIDYITRAE